MTDTLDHVAGRTRVAGACSDDTDRTQEIAAEAWAWELVIALQDALIGASHWRHGAQELLRKISRGELPAPAPTTEYGWPDNA